MDIKLTFSYCISVGLGAFSFKVQLIYPSDKSSVYEVHGRGGTLNLKLRERERSK